MSPLARHVVALVLLVGAALFVTALAVEPDGDTEVAEVNVSGEAPARTWAEAQPGVLDSPESCRRCHAEIYAEWEQDRHSKAWVGELYTRLSDQHRDASCWACHAPRPILETGLDSPPETRRNFRESGINCLTCHKRGNHVVGGRADPVEGAACGPWFDPRFPADRPDMQDAVIAYCGVCHNLHGTHKEFMASKYYREGKTCLSCHMEETVEGPVAKGGPTRIRRVHRFRGPHTPAMLKRAMRIEARREDGRVVARVVNQGAGHKVPTDARHRAIRLRVAFFDAYGQPVPVEDPGTGTPDREVTLDLIRLFYRPEHRDPTQISPAGTPGKDNWRESSIDIPEAAAGGRARLRLYYNFYVHDPLETGTLVEEKQVDLG